MISATTKGSRFVLGGALSLGQVNQSSQVKDALNNLRQRSPTLVDSNPTRSFASQIHLPELPQKLGRIHSLTRVQL